MAEGLPRKKRIRAGHRASATRILNQIDGALAAATPDNAKLSQLKLSLQEKLETLKRLDDEIVELTPEDGLVEEIEQADSYKEGVYIAMINIEKHLSTPTATPSPAAETRTTTPPTHPPSKAGRVKLPKLTLRPFSGDVTLWTTFWDSYESAIHKNDELSDVDKFNYLRSLLERTAHEAISGLTLSAANYHEAVAILKKRFGNKQQIIAKHMDTLLNMEPVTSVHNLKGLRRLHDDVESHVRSLKALGVTSESYGSLLSSVLLSRLPQDLRLIISRRVPDSEWNLDSLLREVEEELAARERTVANSSQPPSRKGVERSPHTATTLTSSTPSSIPLCCYCQQHHPSNNCKNVTQVTARKQILRKAGRCFICLRRGHICRNCRSPNKCARCSGRHHTSICERDSEDSTPSRPNGPSSLAQPSSKLMSQLHPAGLNPEAASYSATPTTSYFCADPGKAVLLQTARAHIYNPHRPQYSTEVRLLFDSGSQRSYVTEQVKELLALAPEREQCLSVATFGATREEPRTCQVVQVGVRMRDGSTLQLSLFAVPMICEPLVSQPVTASAEIHHHLVSLDLADCSDGESAMGVDVLVGSDYYWDLVTGDVCRGNSGPTAIHTRLGWVLSGPTQAKEQDQFSVNLLATHTLRVDTQQSDTKSLDDRLRSFWELESLGIRAPEKTQLEEFSSSVRFQDGRYEVALPWKEVHEPLSDNYQLSLRRLLGLLRRLRQTPSVLREYNDIIRDQVRKGIVQVVTNSTPTSDQVHYLPHHAVIRSDKTTTKLRIVYDASSRSSGPSLNDCLYTGPKFDQRILDILLRFRSHPVALTADIEKAFLMISMAEKDRDVLRFLWVDDIMKEPPEIRTLRFARVVFGVSSSPFLLNATIKHHLEQFSSSHNSLVQNLLRSTYVDDIVTGASSEDLAYGLYVQAKDVLLRGGFNLRKFVTNSPQLQQKINQAEDALGSTHKADPEEHKILGVCWEPVTDRLTFDTGDIAHLASTLEPTKRNVISIIGRFYDPLGFLAPVIITFKVFFQELCESKVEWDQPLAGKLAQRWKSFVVSLQKSQSMSIPRSYLAGVHQEVESHCLCGFCDASTRAYAAVVYLVMKTSADTVVRFVTAKTRVAPIQAQTIPRLELLSALLLSKLITTVAESLKLTLPLTRMRCFTDSQVALFWIQGLNKEWKPFVQNRVNEIRQLVPAACWSHCAGKDNPADMPSRGLTPLELSVNQLWRNGPDWLKDSTDDKGDTENEPLDIPEECAAEMKAKSQSKAAHSLLTTERPPGPGGVMNSQDYSTVLRLQRVTAYVLRAVKAFKKLERPHTTPSTVSKPPVLTAVELAEAERLWIVHSQVLLSQDKNFDLWKRQFGLFLDETGMWRCGGRLTNADLPYSTKHPVLLPRDHPLTTLIVKDAHERVQHNGVKETLTELRTKYWIVRGRSLVRSIVHRCVLCRRFEGAPCHAPPPPPLPTFRVKEEPAFSYTGVDFAGPLYTKPINLAQSNKVWICLYTCCVTRAVHLDIVPDLSTETFIRCLKRFAARRGLPRKFVSDNGKTFKAAAKRLKAVFCHEMVQTHLSGMGVEWLFNIEKAPWWGGVFERMVKSAKRCLRKMIGQAKFSLDELQAAVIEVESIINSRPLSYVSSNDLEEPLTPSHLLIGRRVLSLPDNLSHEGELNDEDFEVSPTQLNRRMKHLNNTLNHFWRRWREEYLVGLRESHRWKQKEASSQSPISVGDVVVVHDEGLPRGFWKLARVESVIAGRDGKVRGATVRLPTKNRQPVLLRRPLRLLYPLEVCSQEEGTVPEAGTGDGVASKPTTAEPEDEVGPGDEVNCLPEAPREVVSRRPRRAAAKRADERRRACMFELDGY